MKPCKTTVAAVLMAVCAGLGCATWSTRYSKPCRVVVELVLAAPDEIQLECMKPGQISDEGRVMGYGDPIGGCVKFYKSHMPEVFVPNESDIIAHELRHVWDRYCKK